MIDQHFMLQNEVVERMVAEPGSKAFSRLSVMLQYRYVIDKQLDVPPDAFQPPPKVDSAIVRMIPYAPHELPAVDERVLGEVVTAAFSQRRKMLRNTLAAFRDRIDFEALGFDLQRRAEDVPVAEYVKVAQILASSAQQGSAPPRRLSFTAACVAAFSSHCPTPPRCVHQRNAGQHHQRGEQKAQAERFAEQ